MLRRLLLSLLIWAALPWAAAATTVTFPTPGNYTFAVPAGVTSIVASALGAGGTGEETGGGGGGACQVTKTVTTGQVIYIQVGIGVFNPGQTDSWVNFASNTPPSGNPQGCIGQTGNFTIGSGGTGGVGQFGDINFTGGNGGGSAVGTSAGGGGGGGAGAGGNGNNASGSIAGNGGPGSAFGPVGGKGGGGGTNSPTPSTAPGGGGGNCNSNLIPCVNLLNAQSPIFNGGPGFVTLTYTVSPVTGTQSQMFLTWPG